MSYDYNGIVTSINSLRKSAYSNDNGDRGRDVINTREGGSIPSLDDMVFQASRSFNPFDSTSSAPEPTILNVEALSQAVEKYSQLSTLCPMVPMLWLNYAFDASRVIEELTQSSDGASAHCMEDEAAKIRLDILEAALAEYPGCGFLWLAYIHTLMCFLKSASTDKKTQGKLEESFQNALFWIGGGSHYNDEHATQIWKLYATFNYDTFVESEGKEVACQRVAETFAERSSCPMKDNEVLLEEASHWQPLRLLLLHKEPAQKNVDTNLLDFQVEGYDNLQEGIEAGRRKSSQTYQSLLQSRELDIQSQTPNRKLYGVETFGLGYGDVTLASTFISFAKSLGSSGARSNKRKRKEQNEDAADHENMMIRIFERGVSECPTVEHIWIAYANALSRQSRASVEKQPRRASIDFSPVSVVSRGVRSCPYSVRLFCLKMQCMADQFTEGNESFDGEKIANVAKEACDLKLLPSGVSDQLIVWQEAFRSIRRYFMHSVTKNGTQRYDGYDGKHTSDSGNKSVLGYSDSEEVLFIIEDLRECFDTADSYLQNKGLEVDSSVDRSKLWLERAITEANIIFSVVIRDDILLSKSIHMSSSTAVPSEDQSGRRKQGTSTDGMLESERCFDKVFKLNSTYLPAWRQYVPFMLNNPLILKQNGLFFAIRKVRALYHREIRNASIAKSGDDSQANTDLVQLCNDLVSFEETHGSKDSLEKANGLVKAKLLKMKHQFGSSVVNLQEEPVHNMLVVEVNESNTTKRSNSSNSHPDDDPIEKESSKNIKIQTGKNGNEEHDGVAAEDKVTPPTNLKKPKVIEYLVRIGNLDYPAHPYTIRIFNLAETVEDMDLVDRFRSCGKIVHARILREKSHHHSAKGKSKGHGLVQFEEKGHVESALKLSGIIGLKERTLQIERSHLPAVPSIVPPECQRVNKRHEGKGKNRPEKSSKKEKAGTRDFATSAPDEARPSKPASKQPASKARVLSFRPRGVTSHAKKKISLETNSSEK
jgi:hypothetical protein